MKFTAKRLGAFALGMTMFASFAGTAYSGANAQDQAEPVALEAPLETATPEESQPQVRFVASEVVQDVPEEPEVQPEAPAPAAASLRELVAATDTSDDMSREMMCLAQAIYFESRGEPLDGQLAVARVIINRAESSRFPDDYCSVVTQRAQFSFVRGGSIPSPNRASSAWTRAKAIARIAHRELWESPADDALFFHARHVRPSWAGRLTARATIDNHIFYR